MNGGYAVPDVFVEEMGAVTKASVWRYFTEETLEDMGYPPRAKGLAYWQLRERQAIRAAHPLNRLRRRMKRVRWFLADIPRRLVNARAALAGEWEYRPEDD